MTIGKFVDLTGQVFTRLTVIAPTEQRGSDGSVVWRCKCDCGNITYVTSTNLKSNNSRSCGCYATKLAATRIKHNSYHLHPDGYVVGKTSNTDRDFLFDKRDLAEVSKYTWREDKHGYIVTDIKGIRSVRLHRFLLDYPENFVDHKNGNTKDNRRCNLREADCHQNQMNRVVGSNSLTGYKGVTYRKDRKTYFARISKDGKNYYLGTFQNIKDAIKARENAERELFGEFAFNNSRGGGSL